MHEKPEKVAGTKLKTTRLRLLLTRTDVHECTTIPTSTIERIENGELPYPSHHFQNLVEFYDYKMQDIYSEKDPPDWIELRKNIITKHRKNKIVINKINEKPKPKEVILYRLLTSKVFDSYVNVSNLATIIKSKYNWHFSKDRLQNALDSIVEEGLITKTEISPFEYKRFSNKLPVEIDPFFETTRKLEEFPYEKTANLVNPTFRKMAIIIISLNKGEKARKELMEIAGLSNETNNVNRTIKILEVMEVINKTELAPKSSKQKYQLTEKGKQILKEVDKF